MKRLILLIFGSVILNGCAEYSALVGPTYTLANSGSVLKASGSLAAGYAVRRATGTDVGDAFINTRQTRACRIIHSSNLNQIFFETLDGIDCMKDPYIDPYPYISLR